MQAKLLGLAATVGALAVSASMASAQVNVAHHGPGWQNMNWRVIGYKTVNGGTDTDTIYTPGRQMYRQIRLCAYSAPLRMRDFDVYFANGGHQDVNTRDRLGPGTCTRVIDLKGRARDISRVRLKYERIHRGGRAPLVRVSAR